MSTRRRVVKSASPIPDMLPCVWAVASETTMNVIRGLVNGRSKKVECRPITCVSIPVPEISGPISDLRVRPDAAYVLGFVTRCNPLAPLEAVGRGILKVPRALGGALGRDPSGKEGAEEAPPRAP